jgi:hypothetical protein
MAKQTEWSQLGVSRKEYKAGIEATIRAHVCNDTKVLRELFGKSQARAAAAGA